jgi:hypothetical protein
MSGQVTDEPQHDGSDFSHEGSCVTVSRSSELVRNLRRPLIVVVTLSALVATFLVGQLSGDHDEELIIPSFVAVDRAFGENADDETLRSCMTRRTKELLVEANATGESSVDYDMLIEHLNDPERKDIQWDNGILSRGTIPFAILRECRSQLMSPQLAIGDLDGDQLPELAYSRNSGGPFTLFWNNGLGQFDAQEINELTGTSSGPIAFVDFDGDRDLDIVSLNMNGRGIVTLVNTGNRSFGETIYSNENAFESIGGDSNWSITTADLNKDGLADLIVNNRALGDQIDSALAAGQQIRPVRLFYNTGERNNPWVERTLAALPELDPLPTGTRRSATGSVLTVDKSGAFATAVADFNNDGWPDIYVAADAVSPRLFIANEGGMSFTDVTIKSGILDGKQNTMGAAAIDYDNDGWLDIIASDTDRRLGECFGNRACGGFGGHRLLRNNKDGTFTDIGQQIGIADAGWGFGFTLTDLNMDGYGDFLVGTGDLPRSRLDEHWLTTFDKPYLLLRNKNGWQDGSLNLLRALRSPAATPVVASADFDGDLRPDLVLTSFESRAPYLLLNRTEGEAALISVRGIGRGGSPTGGEGAKIIVEIKNRPTQTFTLSNMMSNFMVSTSQTPIPIGLGRAKEAKITVTFPSGKVVKGKITAGRSFLFYEGD